MTRDLGSRVKSQLVCSHLRWYFHCWLSGGRKSSQRTQSTNKRKTTMWNLENHAEGLAARALLGVKKALLNIEKKRTDHRQRERSSKMVRTMRTRADEKRRGRNQNQKSAKRKRNRLGAMSRQATVNQKRGRSRSQRGKTGSPPPHPHRPALKGPGKVLSQKWKCRTKKVRGC